MKRKKKIWARIIAWCMVITMLPIGGLVQNVAAATTTDDALTAALAEAKAYTDGITINNSSNDPSNVVKNFGTHFTWDNEKREGSKSYLFDWSYYNGVVFEGLEYLYEVTGEKAYKDYVVEYMSSMITEAGGWATCSNDSSKQCAGYNSTHGADCYKTASLLLDLYEMTNDSRYLTMAKTLYADLDTAATKYSLANAGNNYRHTWASDPSPDLWLDGLYMILPFRAEYAKHIGDTEELDLIVDRMQWVSDNMYNSSKKLFYHAADSATSNSGTYWLRAIGWYAAAIVDIMDSMDGENLEAMKKQLVKLVDGMKACQNASNGMWLNNMNATQSSTNPYETSGTALVCYAVMKAVNNGWLDASYADMATLAFKGICNEKLSGNNLTDICFKGAPGSGNSTFYDNEGKGVGPFIMFYAEVQEYVNKQAETPVEPEEPSDKEVTAPDGTVIKVTNVIGDVIVAAVEETDKVIIEKEYTNYIAYDLEAELPENGTATVSIPVPSDWNATEERLVGLSVENGELIVIENGTLKDGMYSFEVNHFSAKGVALVAEESGSANAVSGDGYLVGGKVYTLDIDGSIENSKNYLIVNSSSNGTGYALTNNDGTASSTRVTVNNNSISVEDDTNIAWQFSGTSSRTIRNNNIYIRLGNSNILGNSRNLTVSSQGNGAYRISYGSNYLSCNSGSWSKTNNASNVYLYEFTSFSAGEAVNFTVSPGSTTLVPEGTTTLEGRVTVAGETVDLSKCTITWSSDKEPVATVSNGTVTAVADGTTNITATLSAVNGTALQGNIVLTIPITVQSKKIVEGSEVLTGNDPVTTKVNVEPDFSNIKLTVTYDDGTKGEITVDNGLVIEGYDITTIGSVYATISYNGEEYGTVRVTVEGNPYEGLDEATEYPEYPADGAVRIDKTATANADTFKNTGVTHVELDVAGISVKKGVNVLLVADISNSMSWDDTTYNYNDTAVTEGSNQRLNASKDSAKTFVQELLKSNEDGSETLNTVSLLAFAGIDGDYNTHSTAAANDDVYQLGELAMTDIDDAEAAIDELVKATTGGTNYDYAFQQAYEMANRLYAENGQEVHIVFMTDGAPTHYNGVYYKSRSNTDLTACMQYVDPTTSEKSSYTSTGYDRAENDIDVTATQNITVYYNDGTTATKSVTYNKGWTDYITSNLNGWAEKVKGLDYVAKVYSIGFGMKNGSVTQGATTSMPTLNNVNGGQYYIPYSATKALLESVASTTNDYYEAEDTTGLTALYKSLATKIRYAGTAAQVTDIVDPAFTLQMASTSGSGEKTATLSKFGITPKITVTTYDLYTKAETSDTKLIGTRKGTSEVLETVTFNEAGTEAYSDKVEDGKKNILDTATDGTVTIEAHYFTYVKTPEGVESFKWMIGNITDKEIVLGFDVYLKNSLEGDCPEGIYYTNEEATLEYIDINGKYATQIFPVPAASWGGASTTIRFYLVNEKGEPVNRAGEVVPMANCIYVGEPVTVTLNLNADATIDAQVIEAAAYVPSEYYLYDINASYTVQTASGDDNSIVGGITPSEPSEDAFKTAGEKVQNGAQTTVVIEHEEIYYTYSVVGFGVRYDLSQEETLNPLIKDKIVIDYGKAVQVDVLANDPDIDGYGRELTGFVIFNANTDTTIKQLNAGSANYTSGNGTYSIVDQKVQFKLNKMLSQVEKVFYVVKYTNTSNVEDFYYLFGELDIIPATTMYYETDFATSIFATTTTGIAWNPSKVADGDTTASDNLQDDGTIGKNQTYGYDSSYENDAYLSNKTSYYVEGQGYDSTNNNAPKTYTTFSFKGTGFEVISRTGTAQGLIKVEVFKDAAMTEEGSEKTISVLNKSESNLELYQIPVVSINDLSYGTHYVRISVDAEYVNNTGISSLDSLNRGNQFYFDAIRVFDPVYGNAVAEAAYAADGEANRQLSEVRALLIDESTFEAIDTSTDGMVFIDRDQNNIPEVGTYAEIGPNNETYLSTGQAVAFKITANSIPASVDLGAKSITGATAGLKATITNNAGTTIVTEESIASSTAQNINLLTDAQKAKTIFAGGDVYVIVTNTGSGVLSITDIKIAYSESTVVQNDATEASANDGIAVASAMDLADPYSVSYTVDAATFTIARRILTTPEDGTEEVPDDNEPEEEQPEVEPNYDIIGAEFAKSNGKKPVIIVTTTQDVTELRITEGKKTVKLSSVEFEDQEDGTRIWTVVLSNNGANSKKKTYTITGCGEDGTIGQSVTLTSSEGKDKNNNKNDKKKK